jgi:SAM-dependent MidA family methyltransferase
MLDATALPAPSADAAAVSAALSDVIAQAIAAAGGSLGFDEYMRMALYEPGLGYYLAGAVKFGAAGDFVTSPEISPMFGACIARAGRDILDETGGDVLEFGAGSGSLAASVLNALSEANCLPRTYTIIELSPDLRERQYATIAQRCPGALARVRWINALPDAPFDGLVIANEILDAFPVRTFALEAGTLTERRVRAGARAFEWVNAPAYAALERTVRERLDAEIFVREDTYVSEINLGIEPWIRDLARVLRHGVALLVDYGYPRAEYYHPSRSAGTLQCHYRHRVHDDPFFLPGLQDLTASVDFTQVAEVADASGFHIAGFAEQGSFLLANGLLDVLAALSPDADEAYRQRLAFEAKVLTLPGEMGSRFKFIALARDYARAITGFGLRDDRHRL